MANLIPLRRGEPIFDRLGRGTRRFNEYIENLTSTVNINNATSEDIADVSGRINSFTAQMIDLKSALSDIEMQSTNIDLSPIIRRIEALENDSVIVDMSVILKRLDAIEAQL